MTPTTSPPRPVRALHPRWLGSSDGPARQRRPGGSQTDFDRLVARCPQGLIDASELFVGLPSGQMGNSEVGHMNIGAGRVVMQDLPRIDQAIADGSLVRNAAMLRFVDKLKASGGVCHLMGLLSPGGVHSHHAQIAGPRQYRRRAWRRRTAARLSRWARHAAAQRPRISRRLPRPPDSRCRYRSRHRQRPLLRHGPRQEMGSGRESLCLPGRWPRRRSDHRRRRRDTGLRNRSERRIHRAAFRHGISRHAAGRWHPDGKFPRRSGPRNPVGIARPRLRRLSTRARRGLRRRPRAGGVFQRSQPFSGYAVRRRAGGHGSGRDGGRRRPDATAKSPKPRNMRMSPSF